MLQWGVHRLFQSGQLGRRLTVAGLTWTSWNFSHVACVYTYREGRR